MKNLLIMSLLLSLLLSAGCSINHPIAKDYEIYLDNTKGENSLPKTELETGYAFEDSINSHRYQFRAATVGYAHVWIVEFKPILDKTLKSQEVQAAFVRLTESTGTTPESSNLVTFDLKNYEFRNHFAHITLNITLSHQGVEILNKDYYAEGSSQGAKMFWGGPFAMKNATQQSTKYALDKILSEFINDVNKL